MLHPGRTALLIGLVVFAVLLTLLPVADDAGAARIDEAFKRALVGFALARGLNGVISVAQGTEVAVQPAGVGLNFAPGEILDPVNDLVERFSWIMMLATSSLGVQKVLLSMSAWQGLVLAVAAAGALLIASHWYLSDRPVLRLILTRVFLFFLLLRFMMPAVILANDWVYETFLANDYEEATDALESARSRIGELNERLDDKPSEIVDESLMDKARSVYRRATAAVDFEGRLEDYRVAAESITENTIRLVVVFLMQTLVFPLLFIYIVFALVRRLTRP